MDHTDELHDPAQTTDDAADLVTNEMYRKARIIGIAATFVGMCIAMLVKYLVTGVIIRDWLGWTMLVTQIALAIIFPFALLRRKHGQQPS